MSENTVDARGKACPQPLIMTKNALEKQSGEFKVLIDSPTAFQNVSQFLADNNITFETGENEGIFSILVTGTLKNTASSDTEKCCSKTGTVFCFRTNKMGEGPEELGKILIQGCCNTLLEIDPLPSALVFYNSGIHLALKDSPVIESLKNLENKGVRILVCGTCANYFDAKDDIGAGIISNMYDILECLSSASRVIVP